jgi:hypothetical protein
LLGIGELTISVLNMKPFNSYNRRTHPAFPSNEAHVAIEAARQAVVTASEAEHGSLRSPRMAARKKSQSGLKPAEIPRHGVTRSQE